MKDGNIVSHISDVHINNSQTAPGRVTMITDEQDHVIVCLCLVVKWADQSESKGRGGGGGGREGEYLVSVIEESAVKKRFEVNIIINDGEDFKDIHHLWKET